MITLDADVVLNSKYYELATKRKNTKAYSSIDQVTDEKAESTAPKRAIDYTSNDKKEILQALKLHIPANRFKVLRQLDFSQLIQMLFLLDKEKLATGLKFFDKDKLRKLIYDLPKEKILQMLFKIFDKQALIEMFPIKEIKHFFNSDKIKKEDLLKVFEQLPKNVLAQMYEAITGIPIGNKNQQAILKDLSRFDKDMLAEGVKALPYKDMVKIVKLLTKQNDELFKEFSKEALFRPFEKMPKSSMIESAKALDPEDLVNMLGKLPNDFMALTLTMLDPEDLCYQLEKNNSDLLISMVQ